MSSNFITMAVPASLQAADPHWDKVLILSHFDSPVPEGFVDAKGHAIQYEAGTTGTTASKFGGYAAAVRNATIDIPLADEEIIHLEDFTLECFVYSIPTAPEVGYGHLFAFGQNNSSNLEITSTANGWISLGINGQAKRINDAKPFLRSVWNHFAVTREAGVFKVWLNGVFIGSKAADIDLVGTSFVIAKKTGAHVNSGRANFTFDELRLTKGVARYTENFTVPTEPFSSF